MHFGRDGLLYRPTGDRWRAVSPSQPGDPARNFSSLLSKILRIDPRPFSTFRYRIPETNPFVNKPGRDEIFAYGLRNPWRFSFDGWVLAIGDVGQGRQEEVNMLHRNLAAGVNFGWPQYEGNLFYSNRPGPHPAKFPIFTYGHQTGGCSVIGGYVVRDPSLPALSGRYLYGDFCTGDLRSFAANLTTQKAADDRSTGLNLTDYSLTSFGRGVNGQLYIAQSGSVDSVSRLEPNTP